MLVGLDWGTVPAWIALLGAIAAAATFAVTRLDAAKSQARSVYVVVSSYGPDPGDHYGLVVDIRNDSDKPIYDVGLWGWDWGGRRRPLWRLATDTAGWMTSDPIANRIYPSISPAHVVQDDSLPPPPWPGGVPSQTLSNPAVMLRFRDANGRRWVRWPDGKLTRRKPSRAD